MLFSGKGERNALVLILLIGLALRLAVAMLAPAWAGPDEPGHYAYIGYIAENGEIPYPSESEKGLLDVALFNPPLYHVIGAGFYAVSSCVYWLRLEAVLFSIACIVLTFLVAKEFTGNKFITLGAAAFIALLPTHVVLGATINNEAAAYAFALLSILFMLKGAKGGFGTGNVLLAGLFFGLAFATRFNAVILGLPFLAVLFYFFRGDLR